MLSCPETVRNVSRPKKSCEKSILPSAVRGRLKNLTYVLGRGVRGTDCNRVEGGSAGKWNNRKAGLRARPRPHPALDVGPRACRRLPAEIPAQVKLFMSHERGYSGGFACPA